MQDKDCDLTEVNQQIIDWANDREIIRNSTGVSQANKTLREVQELRDALLDGNRAEIIDGIGDTYVTLAIIAEMEGVTIKECVEHAYNEIKDRKGKMINGLFIKEEDLNI